MTDQIRTPRLLMRRWRYDDRAPFAALNADPEVMQHFPSPLSTEESDALVDRIGVHFVEHGYGLWALEADGRFVGFTGLSWISWDADFAPALEVGWRLAVEAWGRGYATEAAIAAVAHGFTHVDSIVSFTALQNVRSLRVMRRIGMVQEREFDHPLLAPEDALRRHVLWRADRSSWTPLGAAAPTGAR